MVDGRYSPLAQSAHWLSALLIVAAWGLGEFGEKLPAGAPRALGQFLHAQAGEAILALLCLRLVLRSFTPPHRTPTALGPLVDLCSRLMHIALYVLLVAAPATGVLTLFQIGESLSVAGLFEIASPWPGNREVAEYARENHAALANVLVAFAVVHAAGVLAHQLVFKDRLLQRMLPRLTGN